MTFTDDDLKRLQHDLEDTLEIESLDYFKALLSRLKAAEDLCNHVSSYPPGDVHRDKYEALWRKTKGEGK